MNERSSPRHLPLDIEAYSINLLIGGVFYSGMLANVSDGGLCLAIPGEAQLPVESRDILKGFLLSAKLPHRVEFRGEALWRRNGRVGDEACTLIGIRFDAAENLGLALDSLRQHSVPAAS
jgi:PilZ domain